MNRHLIGCLSMAAIVLAACAAGPPPQPVAEERPPSGEDTARSAAEASEQPRDEPLYATSRPDDEEPVEVDVDDKPAHSFADEPVATLYIDRDSRFVTEEGDEVDLEALDELSDAPLQNRVIEVVIPRNFTTLEEEYDLLHELIDAADDKGADVVVLNEKEGDESDNSDDEGK